jgi:hypothetical protein
LDNLIQGSRLAELLAEQGEIGMECAELFRGERAIEAPVVVAVPGSVLPLGSQNDWADQKPWGEAGRPLISESLRKDGVRLDHQQPRAKGKGFLQEPRVLKTNPYGPAALAKHPAKGCSTGGRVAFAHRCGCISGKFYLGGRRLAERMADAEQNVGQCKGLAILKSLTTFHRRTFRLGFIVVHWNP